jgi:hypothetical protein
MNSSMKTNLRSYTSLAGLVAAMAMAAGEVPGLPPKAHVVCDLVVAMALAVMGYHASDRNRRRPVKKATLLVCLFACAVMPVIGCRVGGLGLAVHSPTFGSVQLDLDGGMIGKGQLPRPPLAPARPQGDPSTNASPSR